MELSSFGNNWKKRFSSRQWLAKWYRNYKLLFFFLFLIVLGLGGWSWYESLYHYRWNDEEKKKYLDSYVKETHFKETQFKNVVEQLKARSASYDRDPELKQDIFDGQ